MKKYTVLMTLFLVLTLALAACAGEEAREGGTGMSGSEVQETEVGLGTAPAVAPTESTPNSPFNTEGTDIAEVTALPDTGMAEATASPQVSPTALATAMATEAMPPSPITATVTVTESDGVMVDYGAVRAEKLLGYDLKNADGVELGEVEDLVVDMNRACVPYAVVRVDDKVGAENQLVLVPFTAFTFDQSVAGEDASFTANIDAATLVSAPGFAADQMPDFGLLNWDEMYNGYWLNEGALAGAGSLQGGCGSSTAGDVSGIPTTDPLSATPLATASVPLTGTMPAATPMATMAPKMTATPLATTTTAMPAVTASPNALGTPTAVNSGATSPQNKGEMMRGVLLASKLIGMDVQDAQGEGLGEVEDILVEAQTGTVRYLVVGAGGILGLGEKFIPVPVKAFDFQNDYALVNVDRDYLTNAPNFNMDEVYGGASGWDSSLRSYWDAYTWPVP